jgi:hypothetical protein
MEGSLVAYKVFSNGSVLQASEINDNLMNQSVMVFSNASSRSAALTSPVEGMLTWREDDNLYEYYNGSTWVGLLTVSGYDLIKTQTIGTSVTSVTVTGAFSETYDSYKILINGGVASAEGLLSLKIGNATTAYNQSLIYGLYSGGSASNAGISNGSTFAYSGAGSTQGMNMNINVDSPFLAKNTIVSGAVSRMTGLSYAGSTQGYLGNTNSYTEFTIAPGSGNMTGGEIAVYGYRKS